MDIDDILNDIQKYHYIGCGKKTCRLISSSNDKAEAKKKAIKFLKPHEDDVVDSVIYLAIIKKSVKNWSEEKNKLLPGPIVITIMEYKVKDGVQLKEIDSGINNQVYITKKYLEKNEEIYVNDLLEAVHKFSRKKLKKGLMEKNLL